MDLFVFKTIENKNKTIILKEFRKPWDKDDYNLPWEKGYYNEPNTLLLDDFPYKALLFSINNVNPFSFLVKTFLFLAPLNYNIIF